MKDSKKAWFSDHLKLLIIFKWKNIVLSFRKPPPRKDKNKELIDFGSTFRTREIALHKNNEWVLQHSLMKHKLILFLFHTSYNKIT